MTFSIERIQNALLNLYGWRIVRSDGAVLLGFTQRREAERLLAFFVTSAEKPARRQFILCGCCDWYHFVEFKGDCREDSQRFTASHLDEVYGLDGWDDVSEVIGG